MIGRVTGLFIHPLKSGRAIALDRTSLSPQGLDGDRRAMLVNEAGVFLTQRDCPAMARLIARWVPEGLELSMDGEAGPAIMASPSGHRVTVEIWGDPVNAALASDTIHHALSQWLGQPVRLVLFDREARRTTDNLWHAGEQTVAFADEFPILITTTASLAAINADMAARGEGSVGMDRFRPNIVIETSDAFAEDHWAGVEINGIRFDLLKPCPRCIMSTTDQVTGSRDVPDPMNALRNLRLSADRSVPGVLFGWNSVARASGSLTIGDAVTLIESRAQGWPLHRRGKDQSIRS